MVSDDVRCYLKPWWLKEVESGKALSRFPDYDMP